MPPKKKKFTPWSSLDQMLGTLPNWVPEGARQRFQAYEKYDQMYWNDPTQYAIRVLEDEQPIYVPNARIIVDTTDQWLMKGLKFVTKGARSGGTASGSWDAFLARERFMSKYLIAKRAGIARGDYAFHITANPLKAEGSRVSIDTLHPGSVIREYSELDPDRVLKVHIVQLTEIEVQGEVKEVVRKLTYSRGESNDPDQKIYREEGYWTTEKEWWGDEAEEIKNILRYEAMPDAITQIPVYWFPNIEWEGQDYGSSELRGLEFLDWACSQGATDTQMALGLEGLGVYATDGGRPVNDAGVEVDWEVAPGKVMEVPAGSYFRRVEGVGTVKPMQDHLGYLEEKMFASSGMTDVARGMVDVQVAQSGIALAIKFMPTLARIEPRDTAHKEILQQMMFDLHSWFDAYDTSAQIPELEVIIEENKLPVNRTERLNELNNMYDRKIISRKTYRDEAKKLGYDLPDDEDEQIIKEARAMQEVVAGSENEGDKDPSSGSGPSTSANGGNTDNVDNSGNQSNNRNRPNESSGTEAGQTPSRQAKS